jgi:hypothetical protein
MNDVPLAVGTLAFGVALCFALLPALSGVGGSVWNRLKSPVAFFASCAVALVALRWQAVLLHAPLNPDEAQMLAQAITLHHYPIPWKDYDGTTSGPLNSMVLLVPLALGFGPDYASARIVGLLLVLGSLAALYVTIRSFYGDFTARVGVLLPFAFLAPTWESDYVHYSSELLPLFFTTLAAAALARMWTAPPPKGGLAFFCGFLLGLVPLCKLQAVPLALVLFVFAVVAIARRLTRAARFGVLARFIAGSASPLLAIGLFLVLTGTWHDFLISYILEPLAYGSGRHPGFPVERAHVTLDFEVFRGYALIEFAVAFAGWIVVRFSGKQASPRAGELVAVCAAFSVALAAAYAIEQPRMRSPHYLLFAVMPIAATSACMLGVWYDAASRKALPRAAKAAHIAMAVLALCGAVSLFSLRLVRAQAYDAQLQALGEAAQGPVAQMLLRHIRPGERVAIWGWSPEYFVLTNSILGTRDSISHFQMFGVKYRAYYRARYLADLARNQPPFFIDAMSPHVAFPMFDDWRAHRHESFAQLASYVAAHYHLSEERSGVRLYARDAGASGALAQPPLAQAR